VLAECRTQDGTPLPHNLTFDTKVVDNQCKWYNMESTYESYGRDGKALSSHSRQRAYAMRQILRLGPLGERVRWFDISVTIYKQVPVEKRRATFRLITVATADLGRYTLAPASIAVPPWIIRLAGHDLPVYPGATKVTVSGAQTSFATAYYEVPGLRYPCMDVLRFYEEWTSKHGWERVGARSSNWDEFADETLRGAPMVFQTIGRWKREASGDELRVGCRYYMPRSWRGDYTIDYTKKWAQDQTVHLSLRLAMAASGGAAQAR
jgi:hypothetical protein